MMSIGLLPYCMAYQFHIYFICSRCLDRSRLRGCDHLQPGRLLAPSSMRHKSTVTLFGQNIMSTLIPRIGTNVHPMSLLIQGRLLAVGSA